MATQYTNSVSYLLSQQWLDAQRLGYINTVTYGLSPMGQVPIVPSSHFMRDEYLTVHNAGTKLTQKRKLNEAPPANSANLFKKNVEHTTIYNIRTDVEKRLAERDPGLLDRMMERKAKMMIMDIDYDIFNGVPDEDGYGLQGLKERIAIGSAYDVNNNATLTINTSATTFKTFLRRFREARDLLVMEPGTQVVAFTNRKLKRAITSGRDELGANVAGFGYMDILNHRVMTVDDIPLLTLEGDSTGDLILDFDENSESSTSIWLCAIGGPLSPGSADQPNGMAIVSSDEVIREETESVITQFQNIQEIDVGLRVPPGSVVRLSRLLSA